MQEEIHTYLRVIVEGKNYKHGLLLQESTLCHRSGRTRWRHDKFGEVSTDLGKLERMSEAQESRKVFGLLIYHCFPMSVNSMGSYSSIYIDESVLLS